MCPHRKVRQLGIGLLGPSFKREELLLLYLERKGWCENYMAKSSEIGKQLGGIVLVITGLTLVPPCLGRSRVGYHMGLGPNSLSTLPMWGILGS